MHVLFLFLCELFSKTKAAFSVLSTSNMHLSQDCTSGRRSVLQQIGATFRGVLKWNGRTWIVWATRLTWFGQIKLHLMYFCYHAMKFTWLLSSGIVSYFFLTLSEVFSHSKLFCRLSEKILRTPQSFLRTETHEKDNSISSNDCENYMIKNLHFLKKPFVFYSMLIIKN